MTKEEFEFISHENVTFLSPRSIPDLKGRPVPHVVWPPDLDNVDVAQTEREGRDDAPHHDEAVDPRVPLLPPTPTRTHPQLFLVYPFSRDDDDEGCFEFDLPPSNQTMCSQCTGIG